MNAPPPSAPVPALEAPSNIELLLERLAPREVARARALLAEEGPAALVERARAELTELADERARFDALARDVEAHPDEGRALIEVYVRATVKSWRARRRDVAALRRSNGTRLDLPALAERLARSDTEHEIFCEALVAVARSATDEGERAGNVDPRSVVTLARTPGRWSRRVEALRLLRSLARHGRAEGARSLFIDVCSQLSDRKEHRWVQPAAIAALAALSSERARAIAFERIQDPGTGDDFLVRERIVELAARLRKGQWPEIVALAVSDPSDHVRITVARTERDPARLVAMADDDKSPKVRAAALSSLSRRAGNKAPALLARAITRDKSDVVVRTIAEQMSFLARRGRLKDPKIALDALRAACARQDISAETRQRVAEELAEIDVLLDPAAALVYNMLRPLVSKIPVGGGMRLAGAGVADIEQDALGRALGVLARADFALEADKDRGALVLYRGDARVFAPWRALFELFHPLPSKRQGFVHTWARKPRGALRAPPAGLAEITATQVPGERVYAPRMGGWGREVPLIDDLLFAARPRARTSAIVGATGTTVVTPPRGRVARALAWTRLTVGYPRWVDLRRRALDSDEPAVQRAYVEKVEQATGIKIEYLPRGFGATAKDKRAVPVPPPLRADSAFPLTLAGLAGAGGAPLDAKWHELGTYALSPEGNRLPHVALYASLILVGMLARGVVIRRSINRDRKAVPLVLGGWGTRGKSGTERLKAGLLQGIGYESLVKTTGCEAMFIHALPGVPAREVFIYRPYDKATVWEQRSLLRLGRLFGARAFLWECMALQPDLVNLLQSQWMRDDYSTITNAYPDHEDVQGPAGFDVATVISEFVPTRGRLFTAEDQMLPLLRDRARERGTTIHVVRHRDSDLIADDMLARFPYHEHPRNIALVAALAQALGVPPAVAITEMADNVVPDLGVLKTYPRIVHDARTLDFTNGMSANERTGALANWTRMKFDTHDPEQEPARWIVTVVNNRGDRVARSEVFARFLVEDISAHRHVLIGSNVSGLVGFIHEALSRHVRAIGPTGGLAGSPEEQIKIARTRLDRAFKFLKIGAPTTKSVLAELALLGTAAVPGATIDRALAPDSPDESFEAAKKAIEPQLPADVDPVLRPFAVSQIARRRVAIALVQKLERDLHSRPADVERAFADAYRAMFMEQIVPLFDYTLTGDQVIDAIAHAIPPGTHGSVMGIQNIKGTGLDFVYRWVSLESTERGLAKLASDVTSTREEGLRELSAHDDYGLYDARGAISRLQELREKATTPPAAAFDPLIARLEGIVQRRTAMLYAKRSSSFGDKIRAFIGKTFDYMDSIRRQRMAREVLEDLVAGRVSHSRAAIEMRDVVARAKGAWMRKKA